MTTDTLTVDLNMPHKALQVIPQGALRLVCREGSVWITLDHEQRDVVLRPGDVFNPLPRQRAIAYALESSVLAQGLPIPANREAAERMMLAVARGGAVAAITGVGLCWGGFGD